MNGVMIPRLGGIEPAGGQGDVDAPRHRAFWSRHRRAGDAEHQKEHEEYEAESAG